MADLILPHADPIALIGVVGSAHAQFDKTPWPRKQDTPTWTLARVKPKAKEHANNERITVPVTGQLAANNSEALREAAQVADAVAVAVAEAAWVDLVDDAAFPVGLAGVHGN